MSDIKLIRAQGTKFNRLNGQASSLEKLPRTFNLIKQAELSSDSRAPES